MIFLHPITKLTGPGGFVISAIMLVIILLNACKLLVSAAKRMAIFLSFALSFFPGNVCLLCVLFSLEVRDFIAFIIIVLQIKDRSSSVVITITEGSAIAREVEHGFNIYIGSSWHYTPRLIALISMS